MKYKTFFVVALLIGTSSCEDDANDEISIETVEDTSDIQYETPNPIDPQKVYFSEHFDHPSTFDKKWIKSQTKKEGIAEDIAKYDGIWSLEAPQRDALKGDLGLVLKTKAKHAAIAANLDRPFVFDKNPLIVQYEVHLQEGQECGGAYLKLLSETVHTKDLTNFHDKTPYSIMFGPDKCGGDNKLHFIFKHKNPLNGTVEEKHCNKHKERIDDYFSDKLPHLYTLILRPDNSFEILVDKKVVNSGSLLEDFNPAVNPPAEIDDPTDKKPEDWDEREKIPDPNAVKPDDWDEDAPSQIVDENAVIPDGWLETEPTHIPDPEAIKPLDWDTDMDGEWEPPLIENPKCVGLPGCGPWEPPLIDNPAFKGKWRPPLINNPNYKGKWRPKRIPNPDFYEDKYPFRMHTVSAVGFELWSMSKDILFDNILITEDESVADAWTADTFDKKRQKIARESATLWGKMLRGMNYRPKTWAAYFIYCSIPVAIYGYYLYRCVEEETFVQKLANITIQYPALWLLYIVVLGIPVAFILYLFFGPSSSAIENKEKEELRLAAEAKKTDEVTQGAPEVRSKSDLEAEEENNREEEEREEEEEDKEKHSDNDSEDDTEPSQGDVPPAEGTRKRKVRKD